MSGSQKSFAATGRNVVIALAVVAVLGIISRVVLARMFYAATGFVPFDLQQPLTHQVIAIQLGALNERVANGAYLPFAVGDIALAVATAWAFALLWTWIFAKAPSRVFGFLMRGGIIIVPIAAALFDIAEDVEFYRLIRGLSGEAYADAIEMAASLHALKGALTYIRDYLTVSLVLVGLLTFWLQRRLRKTSA